MCYINSFYSKHHQVTVAPSTLSIVVWSFHFFKCYSSLKGNERKKRASAEELR